MDPQLPTREVTVFAVVSVVLAAATIAVGLRLYTRHSIIKRVALDDWAVTVALVLAISCGIAIFINTKNGLGHHVWTLKPDDIVHYMKAFYVSVILYHLSLLAVKICILAQYRRIFPLEKIQKICRILLVVIVCWGLSQLFIVIFNCQPVAAFWDKSIPHKCVPTSPQWYINAAGNIATDFAIFVLPLPVLGSLKLPFSEKILVLGIFSFGFFTCAISVIRIKFLFMTEDFTWENVDAACWSVAELCCGITCSCLPTLRPLASKALPEFFPRRKWTPQAEVTIPDVGLTTVPSGLQAPHAASSTDTVSKEV